MIWSSEQVMSIAPDEATARRGEGLGSAGKWRNLEGNENALWGECKSSGTGYYKTQIDLNGPAFKCNCPSLKFPCKHAIGLLLIYVNNSEAFRIREKMPADFEEWLASHRNKSAEPDTKNANEADKAKRRQKRLEKMAAGFEDLEIWLNDLIRQGLSTTEGQAYSYWQNISSRMVDSQIGGVGRILRAIPLLLGSNTKWPEQMLAEFARFYLLAKGFKRLEKLPEGLQTELLSAAGINIKKEDLLPLKGDIDEWLVLGVSEGIDENLNFRRTWLFGAKSQKTALILEFSFGDAGYPMRFFTGQCFEAEVVYYPSGYPLRAIVKEHFGNSNFTGHLNGFKTLESFFEQYSKAVAANPWIFDFPCFLEQITPLNINQELILIDRQKMKISALNKGNKGWKLVALSGGQPIKVFGEWSGELFVPLSVVSDKRIIAL